MKYVWRIINLIYRRRGIMQNDKFVINSQTCGLCEHNGLLIFCIVPCIFYLVFVYFIKLLLYLWINCVTEFTAWIESKEILSFTTETP